MKHWWHAIHWKSPEHCKLDYLFFPVLHTWNMCTASIWIICIGADITTFPYFYPHHYYNTGLGTSEYSYITQSPFPLIKPLKACSPWLDFPNGRLRSTKSQWPHTYSSIQFTFKLFTPLFTLESSWGSRTVEHAWKLSTPDAMRISISISAFEDSL